jgi:cysteine dioxygenase
MKILQGELVERRFAIPKFPGTEGKLKQTAKAEYATGKVTYMSDQLGLHSIANPSPSKYAVSLHRKLLMTVHIRDTNLFKVYTPPNAAVRGCHVYDADNGSAEHVMQGAYDSVRGIVQE